MTTEIAVKPWYRQFWPWFLMLFPAAAVIAGIITIVIAIDNQDHVVVDDYYKKGLAINRVINQQEQAAMMGLVANAVYSPVTGEVNLMISSDSAKNIDSLSLSLVHTTRADYDRHVLLHKDQQGSFKTTIKDIQAGRWNLILEPADKQWRLDAQVVLPATQWVLKPNV
jgi:hypothetical protein